MAVKLKRSLFIGIGGTGANAIIHTKKRFIDAYGEIPPLVGFLEIDTDQDTINTKVKSNLGEDIKLSNSEFLYTRVRDAQRPLKAHRNTLFSWVPEKNIPLTLRMLHGAGQIRSNGRFALHFNHSKIFEAVQRKLGEILEIRNIDNDKYIPNGDDVEINFVFSLGGGTGSGMFIDIAYIVKDAISMYPNTMKTIAFMVLPDVFRSMANGPAMRNVKPNGYGALVDLDYLMHLNPDSTPLKIAYENKEIIIDTPPFDIVLTINNKTKKGAVINDINEISELIGLSMFTGASELSGNAKSSYDNIETVLAGGTMKVQDKEAWANGMGLSELYYDGNKLGSVFAYKTTAAIINNLLTPETESFSLADKFIDDENVLIRENNGDENNYLIDSLLKSRPNVPMEYIQETKNPNNEVNVYIEQVEETAIKSIEANYHAKYQSVVNELRRFISKNINTDSGVGNIKVFLDGLYNQIDIFKTEMENEKISLEEQSASFENLIKQNIDEVINISSVWNTILSKNRVENAKDELCDSVNLVCQNIHEKLRREWAIRFFNKLSDEVSSYKDKITNIERRLRNILDNSNKRAAFLQNRANDKPKTFVIDLHYKEINSIEVTNKDFSINDFIKSLGFNKGILSFSDILEDELSESFWKYCKNLPKALEYRNKSIDEVINKLDKEELIKIIRQLIEKSTPLWSYDFMGELISPELHDAFIIGVPNTATSKLVKDKIFDDALSVNDAKLQFNSTNVRDRVIIYRMEGSVPIYAVNDVNGYKKEYNVSNVDHHIDSNWKMRMDREGFSLTPSRKEDQSLGIWVLALIYGFIKFKDGVYQIYSLEKGDPLNDFWNKLSEYRDDAFNEFKRGGYIDELSKLIDEKSKRKGEDSHKRLIDDVIENSNYKNKYAQINLSDDDLRNPKYKTIAKLISDEILFVKKKLVQKQ